MAVTGVTGSDTRLSFTPASPPLLPPSTTTDLGTLTYDTRLMGTEENYLATEYNATGATKWHDTLELPAHCPDYDLGLLASRFHHYHNLSSRLLNLSVRLDTTEVREHMFGVRVRLSWPRLARDLSFPLTQVSNTTYRTLVIKNPGTQHPLLVQLVFDQNYPSVYKLLDSIPLGLRPEGIVWSQNGNLGNFLLDVSEAEYIVKKAGGVTAHRDSWLFLLPPSTNTTVTVGFTPSGPHFSSAVLLLRNNLTVIEIVQMTGSGAYTQFKFGNRKPGSSTPLLFELAEKHLKDCEREKQRKFPAPNLTVKRSFTARNIGALPISVHGFHISGLPCEGYGFRVLNCEPFNLPPNSTRKVDIAFTPDFTLARVQRTLGVWTSESSSVANYTLVATLPPFLLSSCSSVLTRPAWEPLLYYCAVTFMVFLLVCVLAAAFLESDRALKCALLAMSRDNATVQPVLDLKSLGTGVGLSGSSNSNNVTTSTPSAPDRGEPTTVPWTKHPPNIPAQASQPVLEPEVVKEKVVKSANINTSETERESVPAIFTSPTVKISTSSCKKKEKPAVVKRFSDATDSSWANVFSKPVSSLPKPTPLPKPVLTVTPTATEPCKPSTSSDSKRKLSKKNSNPGRNTRDMANPRGVSPTVSLSSTTGANLTSSTSLTASLGEDTETSSTTTESSHDDGDKEVEVTMALRDCDNVTSLTTHKPPRSRTVKTSEPVKKVSPAEQRNGGSASSLEMEWEEEEPTTLLVKKEVRNNRNRKSGNKNKSSDNGQGGQSGVSRSKSGNSGSGSSKQTNSRAKDKQTTTQKRSADKLPAISKSVVFEPPPPPLAVWDESRASFSDVVARSDSSKHQTEAHTPANPAPAPTMTSATIATSPTTNSNPSHLGPIGSKKTYSSVWDCWNDGNDLSCSASMSTPASAPTHTPATTSSFFMDTFADTRPLQTPTYDAGSRSTCGWTEPNLLLKMLHEEEQRRLEAKEFQRRPIYQDTWSPWEPICSGNAASVEPVTAPTSNPTLWGSDVWAPPLAPPPDTWAPPGLAPRPPPRLDDPHHVNNDLDIGLDYDPFRSLSNIWAPNTTNIWKPSTTNNN